MAKSTEDVRVTGLAAFGVGDQAKSIVEALSAQYPDDHVESGGSAEDPVHLCFCMQVGKKCQYYNERYVNQEKTSFYSECKHGTGCFQLIQAKKEIASQTKKA